MTAAMRTPENLLATARVFGANRFKIMTQVIFRSALPETMSGVRVGVTVSLLVCLTAEYVLGADGIGYLILGSRSLGQHAQSYVGIVIASITGLLLQIGVKKLDNLLNPGFASAFKSL
jgi:sulfonate transport system permease protein